MVVALQEDGARQCALRRGLTEPAVVCGQVAPGICQVCKEQGRNSGSQHGRSNHEHERSSLSSAVAKEVAKGVVHVGQRKEHVKRAGIRMQARAQLQPTRTMVRLAQEIAGSSSGGQDGVQHMAARRQRSAGQDVQARQGLQRALGAKVPT